MAVRLLIFTIVLGGLFADGRREGRRGNEAYESGDFSQASESYLRGLTEATDEDGTVRFGLMNNLGAAKYRLENPTEALQAFQQAAQSAPSGLQRAMASYNAGNAAYRAEDLQRALAFYRRTLLDNPEDENAKFNYEFVKRQIEQQEEGGGEDQPEDQEDEQQEQEQGQGQQEGEGEGQNQEQESPSPGDQQQDQEQDPQQGQDQDPQRSDEGQQEQGEADQQDAGDPQDEGQVPPGTQELSRDQAERILQALENEEAQLLREVQRMDSRPRRVEKDW